VLTGSQLTDVKVQLLAGRAHLKHTEGGDFREATYRAIRNALMNAKSVLMEPICTFELRAPAENYGRIMGDLTRMRADCAPPEYAGETVEISGQASFREISGYGVPLMALTHGRGVMSYRLDHDEIVRDADAVIAEFGYDPCGDDSPDSVFCQKGAGFVVNWKDVPSYAHIPREYNF
jgi:ribosomal protection tetracycline resistance protein